MAPARTSPTTRTRTTRTRPRASSRSTRTAARSAASPWQRSQRLWGESGIEWEHRPAAAAQPLPAAPPVPRQEPGPRPPQPHSYPPPQEYPPQPRWPQAYTRPSQAGRRDRRPVGTLGRARGPPSSRTSPGRATSATRSAPPSSPSRSSSPTSETTPTHGMTVGLPPRRPYGLVPRALPGAPTPGSRATPCFLSRRCQRAAPRASAAAGSAPRRWRSPLSSSSPWPSSRWPC